MNENSNGSAAYFAALHAANCSDYRGIELGKQLRVIREYLTSHRDK
jgi:hypothetical protein